MKKTSSSAAASWFAKGDHDLRAAELALQAEDPLPDIACYHAAQCAEKYLKGYLVSQKARFNYVHELGYLVRVCMTCDGEFASLLDPAAELEDYASDVRYPLEGAGEPSEKDALDAIDRAQRIQQFVVSKMPPVESESEKEPSSPPVAPDP